MILFTVDASVQPTEDDRMVADLINGLPGKTAILMALNKMDLVDQDKIHHVQSIYTDLVHRDIKAVPVSALKNFQLDVLRDTLVALLPVRPPEFPEEQLTDLYEREIAGDLVRAACLNLLRDEVPHSLAVRIDEFTERPNNAAYIVATIFVDAFTQGDYRSGGKMLKRSYPQGEIEK
jgi:GTP-binding protein Era